MHIVRAAQWRRATILVDATPSASAAGALTPLPVRPLIAGPVEMRKR